jgi:PEP-CTERM motif
MRRILTGILSLVFVAGSAVMARADSIFNFEDLPLNTVTTFTETNSGVTATFTSSIPGTFEISTDPTGIGTGQRLIQTDTSLANNIQLTVTFGGQQFQSASLPFAILGSVSQTPQLTLQALLGGIPIGSATALTTTDLGTNPAYSGGFLNFNPGAAFDSFVLTSSINGFAIDDLSVSSSAVSGVPEPAPIALLMFGMAGVLAFVRRRQRRDTAVQFSQF